MRAVVIGKGRMGVLHERVLLAQGHEVVTVDPDPARNASYQMLDDLADLEQFDAAAVAVPSAQLASCAVQATRYAKAVLVEKPMSDTLGDAISIAQSIGHYVIGFTERHNPAVEQLRHHLDLIGHIHHVAIQRLGLPPGRPTAHVGLDLATHDLDVLRFLGFEPRLLHAAGSPRHTVACLDLGGPTATLEASHLHPTKIRTLTVTGSEGMLALDYQRQTLDLVEPEGITPIPVTYEEPLARQWRAFPHGPSAADGIAVLKLAAQITGDTPSTPSASPAAPHADVPTADVTSLATARRDRAGR